jgi:hypothetical protein
MTPTQEVLSTLASRSEEWTHNNLLTSKQDFLLELIRDGLIEPNGLYSRLTPHGKDVLSELQRTQASDK